jgi:hypothetical protein
MSQLNSGLFLKNQFFFSNYKSKNKIKAGNVEKVDQGGLQK